ncbi:uncharacterized protein PG986_013815 [Apiospora aurea]|uniref:Uncharacterized protein n=1 Tax=Apiospora aurea TaxID=335848 RepID=A0ABR1PWM0_9PEZI
MPIGGPLLDSEDHPRLDVIKAMGRALPRGGMAVSILVPVFFTEQPQYFWGNLWPSIMLVLLTVITWYPFSGPPMEFVLLRIPVLLTVAINSAIEVDRIRARADLLHEPPRLFPSSVGKPPSRSGSPLSSVGSVVFAGICGGPVPAPSFMDWQSDCSLQFDEVVEEESPVSNVEVIVNPDLEVAPADWQLRL